ncbi:MAG: non-heme iron oxygenase ferredoxin subunit [Betaproteobacteria bacterium]|nr:MAG: non-heme iron oxygenase ferredoxin subunit [Betaproteobacteria bacterium]RPI48418.1 MAG: non-heme iron oxygenase ferredoxin subunit [Betaproteobacteria bacterium]
MSEWMDVAPADELGAGQWRLVEVDGTRIAVFNIEGAYHAIEDVCTHDGGDLASGCLEGDVIVCPRHGARFSVRTGEALSAPAYEPTATFPVRVERGIVQVRDDRWD